MNKADKIHVLNKRVELLQPADGFSTSLDSVMLAAACPARSGDHVLDLGCGVGGAGLCVMARVPGIYLTGVDIQEDHIDLARENAALNNAANFCNFICEDIREFTFLSSPRKRGSGWARRFSDPRLRGDDNMLFDHIICNPPYLEAGTHTRSPSNAKATAHGHHEPNINVKDWIDCAFRHLKNGGSLSMIHRADHTDKIIQGFGKRFGAIEIIPLWPHAGEAAKRVIIRCLKNRKTPAILHAGIVLHESDGSYTTATNAVLRGMKAI